MNDHFGMKHHDLKTTSHESPVTGHPLRMIAWELTRSCNLACVHCRASAAYGPYEGELSTQEVFRVMDDIASFSKPVIILTGGNLCSGQIFLIWHLMEQEKGSGWSWRPTGHYSMKKSSKR